jgi:hypothetical protein
MRELKVASVHIPLQKESCEWLYGMKGRGYENPSLEIIVIECYSTRGFPLEEACEHFFLNQSVISVVVLILFMCYCGDYAGYITVILPFLAFYLCSMYLLYLVSYKWYQSTFLGRNCGNCFSG